jgi:hypothetical protein
MGSIRDSMKQTEVENLVILALLMSMYAYM